MIILKETNDPQELYFIPRSFAFTKIVITNEETGLKQEFTVPSLVDGQYGFAELTLDLKELDFYTFKVYNDNDDLLYYDKIFCTNQDVQDYSINKDVYTIHETPDNDFIKL